MFGEIVEFFSDHLGGDPPALRRVLLPLRKGGEAQPLRVWTPSSELLPSLRAAGCEVTVEEVAELSDVSCAARPKSELLEGIYALKERTRPGGMVVLVTRRGRPTRSRLCAAFLHAGLREPVQRTAGMSVITAGIV
jgi:hypothetical protein